MNLPKKIKISGFTVKVKLVPNLMTDRAATGEYIPRLKQIEIDEDTCDEQQYSTFIHEIIEAIVEIHEVRSLAENHHDIVILSEALHQVIRDNGKVILP